MGLYFDVGVIVNGCDMTWLHVGDIEWNIIDRGCDVRGDDVKVGW